MWDTALPGFWTAELVILVSYDLMLVNKAPNTHASPESNYSK